MIRAMLLAMLLCALAPAAIIGFGSGDGLNESNSVTAANVVIVPHPVWGAAGSGYNWISYANTGIGGSAPPNTTVPGTPTAVFYEKLPMGTYAISWKARADDTAGVRLVYTLPSPGTLLFAPNPVQDGACAAGPISCEPQEAGSGNWAVNPNSQAWLAVDLYQVGGDVAGVAYEGFANTVPEPGSYVMIPAGLALIWFGHRKLRTN